MRSQNPMLRVFYRDYWLVDLAHIGGLSRSGPVQELYSLSLLLDDGEP